MSRSSIIIDTALKAVILVDSSCKDERAKRSFLARARQEASNIAFNGFPLTLAIIASRSSASSLEQALAGTDLEEFVSRICSDADYARRHGIDSPEAKGYAVYGFTLLHILKKLNLASKESFEDFFGKEARNPIVGQTVLQASIWVKRFAEAYIHV